MQTIQLRRTSGADGILHLEVPVGAANTECAVTVIVAPRPAPPTDWLPDYFERLGEGWQGEKLVRPPQGEHQQRDPLL